MQRISVCIILLLLLFSAFLLLSYFLPIFHIAIRDSLVLSNSIFPCLSVIRLLLLPLVSQIPEALPQEQEERKKEREATRKKAQKKAKKERLKVGVCNNNNKIHCLKYL